MRYALFPGGEHSVVSSDETLFIFINRDVPLGLFPSRFQIRRKHHPTISEMRCWPDRSRSGQDASIQGTHVAVSAGWAAFQPRSAVSWPPAGPLFTLTAPRGPPDGPGSTHHKAVSMSISAKHPLLTGRRPISALAGSLLRTPADADAAACSRLYTRAPRLYDQRLLHSILFTKKRSSAARRRRRHS